MKARLGYSDNSPYRNEPFIDIPSNVITMMQTGVPLIAIPNVGQPRVLGPYSGQHHFPGASTVREIPLAQDGGAVQNTLYVLGYEPGYDTTFREEYERAGEAALKRGWPHLTPKYITVKEGELESTLKGLPANPNMMFMDHSGYQMFGYPTSRFLDMLIDKDPSLCIGGSCSGASRFAKLKKHLPNSEVVLDNDAWTGFNLNLPGKQAVVADNEIPQLDPEAVQAAADRQAYYEARSRQIQEQMRALGIRTAEVGRIEDRQEGGPVDPSVRAMAQVLWQRNQNLPFVQRWNDPNQPSIPNPRGGDGMSTHLMAHDFDENGDWYVYPRIMEIDGELKYPISLEEAKQSNNAIKAPRKVASDMSKNYKKFQKGGLVGGLKGEEILTTSPERYQAYLDSLSFYNTRTPESYGLYNHLQNYIQNVGGQQDTLSLAEFWNEWQSERNPMENDFMMPNAIIRQTYPAKKDGTGFDSNPTAEELARVGGTIEDMYWGIYDKPKPVRLVQPRPQIAIDTLPSMGSRGVQSNETPRRVQPSHPDYEDGELVQDWRSVPNLKVVSRRSKRTGRLTPIALQNKRGERIDYNKWASSDSLPKGFQYQDGGRVLSQEEQETWWGDLDNYVQQYGEAELKKYPFEYNFYVENSPRSLPATAQGAYDGMDPAIATASLIGQTLQAPQSLATEAFTGQNYRQALGELGGYTAADQKRPSDYINNPVLGLGADLLLDPLNLIGGTGVRSGLRLGAKPQRLPKIPPRPFVDPDVLRLHGEAGRLKRLDRELGNIADPNDWKFLRMDLEGLRKPSTRSAFKELRADLDVEAAMNNIGRDIADNLWKKGLPLKEELVRRYGSWKNVPNAVKTKFPNLLSKAEREKLVRFFDPDHPMTQLANKVKQQRRYIDSTTPPGSTNAPGMSPENIRIPLTKEEEKFSTMLKLADELFPDRGAHYDMFRSNVHDEMKRALGYKFSDIHSKFYKAAEGQRPLANKYGGAVEKYQEGGRVLSSEEKETWWGDLDNYVKQYGEAELKKYPFEYNFYIDNSPRSLPATAAGEYEGMDPAKATASLMGQVMQAPQSLAVEALTDQEFKKALGELGGYTAADQAMPSHHINNPVLGFATDLFFDPLMGLAGQSARIPTKAVNLIGRASANNISRSLGMKTQSRIPLFPNYLRSMSNREPGMLRVRTRPAGATESPISSSTTPQLQAPALPEDRIANVYQWFQDYTDLPEFTRRARREGFYPQDYEKAELAFTQNLEVKGSNLNPDKWVKARGAARPGPVKTPELRRQFSDLMGEEGGIMKIMSDRNFRSYMDDVLHRPMETRGPGSRPKIEIERAIPFDEQETTLVHELDHVLDGVGQAYKQAENLNFFKRNPESRGKIRGILRDDPVMGPQWKKMNTTEREQWIDRIQYYGDETELRARLAELRYDMSGGVGTDAYNGIPSRFLNNKYGEDMANWPKYAEELLHGIDSKNRRSRFTLNLLDNMHHKLRALAFPVGAAGASQLNQKS